MKMQKLVLVLFVMTTCHGVIGAGNVSSDYGFLFKGVSQNMFVDDRKMMMFIRDDEMGLTHNPPLRNFVCPTARHGQLVIGQLLYAIPPPWAGELIISVQKYGVATP